MSKNQSKSAYNQARSQQNWEMQQYQNMWGPQGSATKEFAPITAAAQPLLSGSLAGDVRDAERKRAASNTASIYGNLQDALNRSYARQGGYAPGFGANTSALARQAAEQENLSTISPEENYFQNYVTGATTGAGLQQAPYQARLAALGLTDSQIADLIKTQAGVGVNTTNKFGWNPETGLSYSGSL